MEIFGVSYKKQYIKIIDSLLLDDIEKDIIKTVWLNYLYLTDKKAQNGWRSHNITQIIIIILGLLIPVIEQSQLNTHLFFESSNITIISVLGLIVAGLTTLNRQIGYEEKWKHYRRTAETVRNDGDDYFALSGAYESFTSHKDAFKVFLKTTTTFKRQEVSKYIIDKEGKKVEAS